jgi:hypothetical protein
VLYAPDERVTSLYFPTTVLVSLVYTTVDGKTAAMGLIGNDGVVGVPLLLGVPTPPLGVQRALLRALQALLTQVAQTAVCNQRHTLEQRLCRWLLFIRDRVPSDEVLITHEGLAQIVGAYRESVTVVAGHLQAAGFIRAARGSITILDRPGSRGDGVRVLSGRARRVHTSPEHTT